MKNEKHWLLCCFVLFFILFRNLKCEFYLRKTASQNNNIHILWAWTTFHFIKTKPNFVSCASHIYHLISSLFFFQFLSPHTWYFTIYDCMANFNVRNPNIENKFWLFVSMKHFTVCEIIFSGFTNRLVSFLGLRYVCTQTAI